MTKVIIGVVTVVVVACLGLPAALMSATTRSGTCDTASAAHPPSDQPPDTGTWDTEQLDIATTIIDVGQARGMPRRGWIIAVATALQESGLRNLPHLGHHNDHDSIGVFQQRPSQGWGSAAQLADPAYQANAFYHKLLAVPGWETMPLTQAAQAVQISAFPDAYTKWADDASHLVQRLTGTLTDCAATPTSLPAGFRVPADTPPAVATAMTWAIGQLGTPYHFGGSCTAPHSGDPARQCDCSSLMQVAYRTAGITIPRTTHDQIHAGTPVTDPAQLHPGDLILIPGSQGTRTTPRHIGMYLGSGLIIHAPSSGDVVKLATLNGWANQIAAIRRIVPR
ncbi:NlpC/P60 family protein [Micromonospora sp. HM134]|uniref:NlpC/P60 family protein n=1 Tax=Micromonospora sp. HM134 TaxID=2583243 RepID=UPI00119893D8|nr:NlpC/P60 family protein [Micromonospora sp. HM134]QDY09484.1 NlpC/P60 family protein [Micromonospora sp. HM134]